jgi:predicted phosphodiesterase
LFVATITAQAGQLTRYPYVQNVTGDSVVIDWRTDVPEDSVVEYGATPGLGSRVRGTPGSTNHQVILTGLSPDSDFYYRIVTNASNLNSSSNAFHTARAADDPYFAFAVVGDSGDCSPEAEQVATQVLNAQPDLMLHVGDMAYPSGEDWSYDECFFSPYRDVLKTVPVFPSLGNHDVETAGGAPYLASFVVPENATNPAHRKRYYSFDYGNAHFIALDTELDNEQGVANRDQRTWLENDLANATNATWKFIYFHRPPYSSGNHGSAPDVRQIVAPLAQKYNVDVVFSGHDHSYERTAPLLDDQLSDNGVTYIVTGGGGRILYPVGQSEWTAFSGSFSHFMYVDIEDQTLTLQAIDRAGNVQDQYVLTKGTLSGTITDAQGNPVQNATVTILLQDRQRAILPGLSDSNYTFYLAEGAYDVQISAPGCAPKTEQNVQIIGEQATALDFVLECQ